MSNTSQREWSTMSTKSIVDKFKNIGIDKIPTVVTRDLSTVEGRAENIVDEHIKRMEDKTMCVIQELSSNEYGILSFKRSQYSRVYLEGDNWKCDCPSFRFGSYDKCKHILAIEIIKKLKITLPTLDEVMGELYDIEK